MKDFFIIIDLMLLAVALALHIDRKVGAIDYAIDFIADWWNDWKHQKYLKTLKREKRR